MSPKTCISMTVTDSSLVGIDLGKFTRLLLMSNFHLSHFCLTNGGKFSSQGGFRSKVSRYSNVLSKWAEEIKPIGLYTEASSLNMLLLVLLSWRV